MSLLTLPPDYLDTSKLSPLGVLLAHGADAEESWRGPLLERLAASLAQQARCCLRPLPGVATGAGAAAAAAAHAAAAAAAVAGAAVMSGAHHVGLARCP